MRVADSVVVITGGARGIGAAVGGFLARLGARVVLSDILEPELNATVDRIRADGGRAIGIIADVTRDQDVVALMDSAIATFGAINVVCANAGIIRDGLMIEPDLHTRKIAHVLSTDAFRAVLDVNVVGAFITVREAARRMADNRWPGLLLITSSVHRAGRPGQINYSSSKAAVALWPKILAGELHSCGIDHIRVVAIAPGYTATEGVRRMDPVVLQSVLKDVHMGRLIEPEELAATVAHVIENEAIDATTIEVTAGVTYGPWQRAT
jgi:3-oxoacyl-[acyl-carrier protein] reductase